jgi:ApaG protein
MTTVTRPAHSDTLTEGIRIQAIAQYVAAESDPDRKRFVFVYKIRMTNEGDAPAKLRSRHWIILDANNERRDVRGPGVVGKEPDLQPGESFEYTSSCPLGTAWGTMEGTYAFERADGRAFEVAIGRFFLVPPPRTAALSATPR